MPYLESEGSETHESAIKRIICVFVPMVEVVAYIYVSLHMYVHNYVHACISCVCMYASM